MGQIINRHYRNPSGVMPSTFKNILTPVTEYGSTHPAQELLLPLTPPPMPRNSYYRTPHWKALKRACHERDGWKCTVKGCQTPTYRLTCDHINQRPNIDHPTPLDVLSNTRTLCGNHDAQVKELPSGKRSRAGTLTVNDVDANGWPVGPDHPWNRA